MMAEMAGLEDRTGDAERVLGSDDMQDVLAAALATAGLHLESWQLDALHARPGAETSGAYDVFASGERLYLVATTAALTAAEQEAAKAVKLASDTGSIFVWRHPFDPKLPGLVSVTTAEGLGALLASTGEFQGEVTELDMLVLRPMRRAVLQARVTHHGEPVTVFVKVVRPERAAAMLQRHGLVSLSPQIWDAGQGVLITAQAAGVPLTEYLFQPDGARRIDPQRLVDALDSLDPRASDLPTRRSATNLIETYADAAVGAGWDARQVRGVADVVAQVAQEAPGPLVATHGDFHPANVFVDGAVPAAVTALIDVDTLGPGYRVDDLACMLAHLHTLPTFGPGLYPGVADVIRESMDVFSRHVPPHQLRARAAAVLVSLLVGCEDRERGQRWLELGADLAAQALRDRT